MPATARRSSSSWPGRHRHDRGVLGRVPLEPPWWVHVLIWGRSPSGSRVDAAHAEGVADRPAVHPSLDGAGRIGEGVMIRLQASLVAHPHLAADLRGPVAGARHLADGAPRMEAGHPAIASRPTRRRAPISLDELLRGNPLRHEYGTVKRGGTFLLRQGVLPRRAQPQEQGRPSGRDAAPDRRWPHRAVRSRLDSPGAEGSCHVGLQGQVTGRVELTGIVRRNQERRAVRARERARQERLVPCRRAADAQDGRAASPIPSSTPSSSMPTPRPIPAACRSAARRASTSPTTICSTPSPGS